MSEPERWTTSEAAAYCGGILPGAFRKLAARYSLYPVAREAGLAGENLWDVAEVKAMQEARPGQGHRTDLHTRVIPAGTLTIGDRIRFESEGEFGPTRIEIRLPAVEGERFAQAAFDRRLGEHVPVKAGGGRVGTGRLVSAVVTEDGTEVLLTLDIAYGGVTP